MFQFITRMFAAPVTSKPAHRPRLSVERLEDRTVPTAWTAATVAELVQHINDANASPGPDTITLAAGATFTLTAVNNTTYVDGPDVLPVIATPGELTIIGNGDTIERS